MDVRKCVPFLDLKTFRRSNWSFILYVRVVLSSSAKRRNFELVFVSKPFVSSSAMILKFPPFFMQSKDFSHPKPCQFLQRVVWDNVPFSDAHFCNGNTPRIIFFFSFVPGQRPRPNQPLLPLSPPPAHSWTFPSSASPALATSRR